MDKPIKRLIQKHFGCCRETNLESKGFNECHDEFTAYCKQCKSNKTNKKETEAMKSFIESLAELTDIKECDDWSLSILYEEIRNRLECKSNKVSKEATDSNKIQKKEAELFCTLLELFHFQLKDINRDVNFWNKMIKIRKEYLDFLETI